MLGATQLAAHSVAYNIIPLAYHVPAGVAIAVQTRIATVLAEDNPRLAKKTAFSAIICNLAVGFCTASMCYLLKDNIISLFTSDSNEKTTIEAMLFELDRLWPIMVVFLNTDAVLAACSGVLRGLSLHARLSMIIFLVLWVLGIPIELVLGFKTSMGLLGLWVGLLIIYLLIDFVMILTICCHNWTSGKRHKYQPVSNSDQ